MSHCVCFQVPTGEHFSPATIAVTTLVGTLGVPVGFSPLSRSAVGPDTGLCNLNRLYHIFLPGAVTLGPQQLSKAPVTPQVCPIESTVQLFLCQSDDLKVHGILVPFLL